MSTLKRQEPVIWLGNGFGIEFIVVDPYTIEVLLLLEKDPTLTDNSERTVSSTEINRDGEFGEDEEVISEEPMRDFAVRARQEALEWAEIEIAEYKLTEDLTAIMGEVLDSGTEENDE